MKKRLNRSKQRFRFYARMVDVRIQLCKSDSYSGDLSSGHIIKLLKMLDNCLAEYKKATATLKAGPCTCPVVPKVCLLLPALVTVVVSLQSVLMKAIKTYFVI